MTTAHTASHLDKAQHHRRGRNRQQRDCTLYNDVRPHSSLGYLTPAAFKAKHLLNNAPRSVVRTDDIL